MEESHKREPKLGEERFWIKNGGGELRDHWHFLHYLKRTSPRHVSWEPPKRYFTSHKNKGSNEQNKHSDITKIWNFCRFVIIPLAIRIRKGFRPFIHDVDKLPNLFQNLAVFKTQDFQSIFGYFPTLCMKVLNLQTSFPRITSSFFTQWPLSLFSSIPYNTHHPRSKLNLRKNERREQHASAVSANGVGWSRGI